MIVWAIKQIENNYRKMNTEIMLKQFMKTNMENHI